MSNHHLSRRVLAAIMLAPLAAALACAPRVRTGESPEPSREASAPSPAPEGGGKTLENLLVGRFPGVSVTPAAGGGLQIRIRGGSNSFYASNEPLYVVDDTPLPDNTGGIVFLNPYDIERIEVLKNPTDIGLYGIRGANGVIKITTMRPGKRQ